MRTAMIAILLAATIPTMGRADEAACPDVVAGKVFLDANGNGVLDGDEKGLAGVRVTDGVHFVTTDTDGAYTIRIGADPSIPYRPAQTVGVCWPTGTWPSGQWWIRLSKIQDPTAVDFPLRPDVQKLPFVYLHMTDPHEFFNTAHMDFATFVNALPSDVKFIIDTGDSYRPKSAEKPFNLTFISTVGNHDTWESSDPPPDPDDGGYGPWTKRLGPVRWSFDFAGIHFVGVDVIGGHKVKAMVDWLAKDLAGVKPETRVVLSYHYPSLSGDARFTRLMKDYNIELVQGGHSHAYDYFDGDPPIITAFHWQPPGACNVMVVGKDHIDIGAYCIGCKKAFGRHSRRCPISWANHILLGHISGHFAKLHTLDPGPLPGLRTVTLSEPRAFVRAKIAPGTAKRVGVRIGGGQAEGPLEIAFTGDRLIIDGASVPFSLRPGQKSLDLTIFAHYHMLTVWANNYIFMEKPVALTRASAVSVFAEGGDAAIESVTVQEVKSDPDNRETRFRCGCGHGALRRVPVPR